MMKGARFILALFCYWLSSYYERLGDVFSGRKGEGENIEIEVFSTSTNGYVEATLHRKEN